MSEELANETQEDNVIGTLEKEFKQCECFTCHCPFVTDTPVCNNCRNGEHAGDLRDTTAICDCICHDKSNKIEDEADCKRCNCY